ncbi:MAG: sulfatase [Pseudomonadota bacterium]
MNRVLLTLVLTLPVMSCVVRDTVEPASQEKNAATAPPNFVVLFADDLGYGDLQSFGHPYTRTPHIDAMAAAGQRWTDFYVASPVCSPSRGALLTGRLPVRTGLYGERIGVYFPREEGGFPAAETTLAELLRQQGYRTGIFGKWHLGDAPHAWPTRHGFDEWLGLPYSNDMDWVGELDIDALAALRAEGKIEQLQAALAGRAAKYAKPEQAFWNVPLLSSRRLLDPDTGAEQFVDQTVERPAEQTTLTKRYTQAAVSFIQRAQDQPFLLYLPYAMPHTPLFRSAEFADTSLAGRYGDVIEEIDWSVGQVRQALEEAGVSDNTLVVFTSDNGPWLTMGAEGGVAGPLRHGKGTTFEGGMRVPAVFAWPGRMHVATISELGSTLDLYTTMATLAGADPSLGVDGYDLSATLLEGAPSTRQEMPFYRSGQLYAFRQGPWKLHFITEGAYGQPPVREAHNPAELYHLPSDPGEKFNVAAQHEHVVRRLTATARAYAERVPKAAPLFDRRLAKLAAQ